MTTLDLLVSEVYGRVSECYIHMKVEKRRISKCSINSSCTYYQARFAVVDRIIPSKFTTQTTKRVVLDQIVEGPRFPIVFYTFITPLGGVHCNK
jgi:hypothetical protein